MQQFSQRLATYLSDKCPRWTLGRQAGIDEVIHDRAAPFRFAVEEVVARNLTRVVQAARTMVFQGALEQVDRITLGRLQFNPLPIRVVRDDAWTMRPTKHHRVSFIFRVTRYPVTRFPRVPPIFVPRWGGRGERLLRRIYPILCQSRRSLPYPMQEAGQKRNENGR